MSSRASTSRLSLEDWDQLCPLSKQELVSVSRIQAASNEKPIPTKLLLRQPAQPTSRPSTPSVLRKAASHVNLLHAHASPSTTSPRRPLSSASNARPPYSHTTDHHPITSEEPLELLEPIATTQQFHDWFAQVERSLELEQEQVYRTHLDELQRHIESCETVLEQLDDARGLLSEMEANYRFVEDNSSALQTACETMLDEQKHLIEVTEAISARLEYFRALETATRMLNLPGEDLVLQEDFLNVLDRLDVCLDYLKANRDFKDAEIYLIRFQQCLTRSMTLIKMYFVSTIRKLTSEVADKMTGKELSETALNALLYTKFASAAETLRILTYELEKRGQVDKNEYGALLQECYAVWFASRGQLLSATLQEEVRRMDPGGSDLIKLARAGCNHLRSVCMSEWELYKQLFSTGETEAYKFLESLCDYLYDSLRPRILHEPRLETLCELCTVLSAMMGLDSEANVDDDDDDDDRSAVEPNSSVVVRSSTTHAGAGSTSMSTTTIMTPLGRLKFSKLLQTIQQDAQTRLVFRAQAVIQTDVLHYVPTPADLEYPEKLLTEKGGVKDLALWTEDERLRESEVGGFRVPREEVQQDWFPTLRRTVWVLSKLNTYVNNAIFEDFAGEAVTLCRQSLSTAAAQIRTRPPGPNGESRQIDGQLFLIRHLLLLKEMIRSVDMVQIERAADFSTVTDALVNLLRNTSVLFNPNALFELASKGIPSFTETMRDAKTDLDSALKRACEELISDSSSSITSALRKFLDQCGTYLSATPTNSSAGTVGGAKDLPSQVWASAEKVTELHETFVQEVEAKVKKVAERLKVYLNDRKTSGVLLPPLLDEIVETYSTFYNLTRSEYGFVTTSSLTAPSVIKEKLQMAVQEVR